MGKQTNDQINRMKEMMRYGAIDENKRAYSGIEYSKVAADGNTYGIVREGTKFYIKVANKANNPIKEDFDYLGGFRNRKDYEYSSYANALKNFEMKMMSINESLDTKNPIVESWNPSAKEEIAVEATEKMRKEIRRQKQIMHNTNAIQESKSYSVDLSEDCTKNCVSKECSSTQKNNITKGNATTGTPKGANGDPFTCKASSAEHTSSQKTNIKNQFKATVNEEDATITCDDDCIDNAQETTIGDSAPFTNKVKCDGCETKETEQVTVTEDLDFDVEDDMDSEADGDVEDDVDVDDVDGDIEVDVDDNIDSDYDDDDIENRLASMEDLITKIADKLGIDSFEDDKLYDDEDEDDYDEDLASDEDDDFDSDNDNFEDENDDEVFESKNYRKLMNKINEEEYFGKHPAYRKSPMKHDSYCDTDKEGYYDMNDDSVYSEEPFGNNVGDGDPFDMSPEKISNAIAESIRRVLKKK